MITSLLQITLVWFLSCKNHQQIIIRSNSFNELNNRLIKSNDQKTKKIDNTHIHIYMQIYNTWVRAGSNLPASTSIRNGHHRARKITNYLKGSRTDVGDCDVDKEPYHTDCDRSRGFPPLPAGLQHMLSVTEPLRIPTPDKGTMSMDLMESRRPRPAISHVARSVDRERKWEGLEKGRCIERKRRALLVEESASSKTAVWAGESAPPSSVTSHRYM
jgi:hypothetical protein